MVSGVSLVKDHGMETSLPAHALVTSPTLGEEDHSKALAAGKKE